MSGRPVYARQSTAWAGPRARTAGAEAISGLVVEGERRGRTLGFPTANIEPRLPLAASVLDGVYAATCDIDDDGSPERQRHAAAVSIGANPTFDGRTRTIEAYLLDFDGNLYGRRVTLNLLAFLRPMVRFDSIQALVTQMNEDVREVRSTVVGFNES